MNPASRARLAPRRELVDEAHARIIARDDVAGLIVRVVVHDDERVSVAAAEFWLDERVKA